MRYYGWILLLLGLAAADPAAGQTSATWQQRVRYEMDITLDTDRHQMAGFQRLTYYNHSPDTLDRVFYHLYFNAFHPNSMMAERNRQLPDPDARVVPRIFELGPDEVGFYRIHSLTQDGRPAPYRSIDDTVMEVDLPEPIPPGGSAVFEMRFLAQVPLQTRRSGRDNREGIDYSMAQWYPKLAQYDERGWHADPYVGREFYAPFGTFDVRITLPAAYVIGSTGVLQNPEAVGHGYGQGTAATNGATAGAAPGDSLTWHFRAENVHDFAWAADPDYRHDRIEGPNGITYHLLYQPDVAEAWARMREWVPALIEFFSERYGRYPYPQFTVIQAGDGGMEYPMINFITGRRSPMSLLSVTAHEAAHEWFYAALGTNEARYAWMDEGLTNFATTEAVAHILGNPSPNHQSAHLNILAVQHYGLFERLNTPSDWFETNAAYGTAAYAGGQMIVDMLGYVMSDPVRDRWLREYFRRFKFRHPNPYDLEVVAEDVSGLQLDWFFEQFTNSTRRLDYAVEDLDVRLRDGAWETTVTLAREDEIVMPIDVRLTLADGSTQWVNIPLSIMQGHKPVPEGWIVAAPWFWTSPTYTLRLSLPVRVVRAEIDPLLSMPDYNRLNNASGFPLDVAFLQPPRPNWVQYSLGWRPLAQYSHDFGAGVGLQARGVYLFGTYPLKATLKLWPQVLLSGGEGPHGSCHCGFEAENVSALDGIDYELTYAHPLRAFGPSATASLALRKHLGIIENTFTFQRTLGRYPILSGEIGRFSVTLQHQYNPTSRTFQIDDFNWMLKDHLASAVVAVALGDDVGRVAAGLEVGGSLTSGQRATHFTLDARKTAALGRLQGLAHARLGLGVENLALHKRFRLGAASFEEAWRNAAFRTVSTAFENPLDEFHFDAFAGPGPVAYLLSDRIVQPLGHTTVGTNLIAGSLSLSAAPLTQGRWLRPLEVELFSGAGQVWNTGRGIDGFWDGEFLADAGLGLTFDLGGLPALTRWTAQSDVLSTLRLSARFPLWVSDPQWISADEDAFAFRWLLGIEVMTR